jgi:hypothetical protein
MAMQTADVIGGEAMTVGGGALLPIENTGNDGVGIMDGETAHQRHSVFVCTHRREAATRQIEIDLGKSAAAPISLGATRRNRHATVTTAPTWGLPFCPAKMA